MKQPHFEPDFLQKHPYDIEGDILSEEEYREFKRIAYEKGLLDERDVLEEMGIDLDERIASYVMDFVDWNKFRRNLEKVVQVCLADARQTYKGSY